MPVSDTRLLYTIDELRDLDALHSPDITRHAYERALEWVREGWTQFDYLAEEVSEYLAPELFGKAGIVCDPDKIEYDLDRRYFSLPPTNVNVPVFLAALKAYYDGRDYRGPEYIRAERHLFAPTARRHAIDLRSHDARLAGEGGLFISREAVGFGNYRNEFNWEDAEREPGFSDAFRQDCEEFLHALRDEARHVLEVEAEYQISDEHLHEVASINEWYFDREGRTAQRTS